MVGTLSSQKYLFMLILMKNMTTGFEISAEINFKGHAYCDSLKMRYFAKKKKKKFVRNVFAYFKYR